MTNKLKPIWKYTILLLIGILIGTNLPIQPLAADIEFPNLSTKEQDSPLDRIQEDEIQVLQDRIIIEVASPKWARIADTKSMEPALNKGSHALQITPKKNQLQVGDIISYKYDNITIIHRIVEIGNDGEWYAHTKGDNNPTKDKDKVRFEQITKVLIGIIY